MGRHSRLVRLIAAGIIDSLCLSIAWTVIVLDVARNHGFAAVGALTAATLVGVALSAPVTSALARRLDGRRLVRRSALAEGGLRLLMVGMVLLDAPVPVLAACALALNVSAWTCYAAMRAEVAAVADGAGALTTYGTVVAAVEAIGIGLATLLPVGSGTDRRDLLAAVAVGYAASLLPTVLVAGGSRVPRATASVPGRRRTRAWVGGPVAGGAVLMLVGSAPTLLAVVLAERLHGLHAVGLAALSFTLGSLAAPALAHRLQRWPLDRALVWSTCALGMLVGWLLAPHHIALLCLAQLLSGLFMTALEGLLDTSAAHRRPAEVTGALAQATAARALGSAAATALFPVLVLRFGEVGSVGVLTGTALLAAPLLLMLPVFLGRSQGPRHRRDARVISPIAPVAAATRQHADAHRSGRVASSKA